MAARNSIQTLVFVLVALGASGCARPPSRYGDGSPVVVPAPVVASGAATSVPCACAPSFEPTRAPAAASAAPTPSGDWFYVTYRDGGDKDGDTDIDLTVQVARFGSLTAQTAADASCISTGQFRSGAQFVTNGLGAKRADSQGLVSWTFAAPRSEDGPAWYWLTCAQDNSMRTARIDFIIQ